MIFRWRWGAIALGAMLAINAPAMGQMEHLAFLGTESSPTVGITSHHPSSGRLVFNLASNTAFHKAASFTGDRAGEGRLARVYPSR